MSYTAAQPDLSRRGVGARIYARQLSLGLLWSGVAIGVLGVFSFFTGDSFDVWLSVVAVVFMTVIQTSWSRAHIKYIRRAVVQPGFEDYMRAPARQVMFSKKSEDWINTLLIGGLSSDLDLEVKAAGSRMYQVRRGWPERAGLRITVEPNADATIMRIEGHIPWWVGVDDGHCHKLVLATMQYLLEHGATGGSAS